MTVQMAVTDLPIEGFFRGWVRILVLTLMDSRSTVILSLILDRGPRLLVYNPESRGSSFEANFCWQLGLLSDRCPHHSAEELKGSSVWVQV